MFTKFAYFSFFFLYSYFNHMGKLAGGYIDVYLLEK